MPVSESHWPVDPFDAEAGGPPTQDGPVEPVPVENESYDTPVRPRRAARAPKHLWRRGRTPSRRRVPPGPEEPPRTSAGRSRNRTKGYGSIFSDRGGNPAPGGNGSRIRVDWLEAEGDGEIEPGNRKRSVEIATGEALWGSSQVERDFAGQVVFGDIWRSTTPKPRRALPWRRPSSTGRPELAALARGSLLTLVGSVASSILGAVLIVVIARGSPTTRAAGVLFEAINLFMILSNTTELGADTGLIRMIAGNWATGRGQDTRRMLSIALWPVLLLSSLAAVLMYAFAPQLSHVLIRHADPVAAARYIRIFAPFLPLATLMTVVLAASRGFGTMWPYVTIQNIGVPLARPILVGLAIVGGLGTVAIALAWALPAALGFGIGLMVLLYQLKRAEHSLPKGAPCRPPRQIASEFWRFSAPRGLAGFFQATILWLNVLLVGALRSSSDAALYTTASRLVGVGTFALQAMGVAIAPSVARLLAQNEHRRAEDLFQTGTWWIMVTAWPMYIAFALFAPQVLRLLYGPRYVSGSLTLVILSLSMLTLVGTGNNKIVLLMGGGSGANLGITAVSLALNVGLNLLLIPHLGINGASLAFAASVAFDMTATTYVVWKRMHLEPFGRGYIIVAGAAVLCFALPGLALRTMKPATLPMLALYVVVSSAVYLGILWRFRKRLRLPILAAALRGRVGAGRRWEAQKARSNSGPGASPPTGDP